MIPLHFLATLFHIWIICLPLFLAVLQGSSVYPPEPTQPQSLSVSLMSTEAGWRGLINWHNKATGCPSAAPGEKIPLPDTQLWFTAPFLWDQQLPITSPLSLGDWFPVSGPSCLSWGTLQTRKPSCCAVGCSWSWETGLPPAPSPGRGVPACLEAGLQNPTAQGTCSP